MGNGIHRVTKKKKKLTSSSEELAWKGVKVFFVIVILATVAGSIPRPLRARASRANTQTAFSATIRPLHQDVVFVDFPAYVAMVKVKPGDSVLKGDLLMILSNDELERAAGAAERRLISAGQRFSIKTTGPQARYNLAEEEAARSVLNKAKERLQQFSSGTAEESLRAARAQSVRVAALVERKLATFEELEAARRLERAEEHTLQNSKAQAARLRDEVDQLESQLKLLRLRREMEDSSSSPTARLDLEDAKSELDAVLRRAADLRVVAPRDGVVLGGLVRQGDHVLSGVALAHIGDLQRLEFRAAVPANVARALEPGIVIRARVPTDPPQWMDTVIDSVDKVPDPQTRAYTVRATVPNPSKAEPVVGMEGALELPAPEAGKWRLPF